MGTYQAISLMISFGMLLLSLISLIIILIREITRDKNNHPVLALQGDYN